MEGGILVTLFKTALLELKHNLKMVIITLLQLIVALIITGIMVSSVFLKYQTYAPFKDYFEGEGLYLYFDDASESADPGDIMSVFDDSARLLDKTQGIEIISAHRLHMYMDKPVCDISYDDEIIQRYVPPLKEGRWLDPRSGEIEVVISDENNYGWKLNDIIDICPGRKLSNNDTSSVWYKARVVGIVKKNAEIFGITNRSFESINYKHAYAPYDAEVEGQTLMLMSQSVLQRVDPHMHTPINGVVLIKYPDGTPEEIIQNDQKRLAEYGARVSITLPELEINSKIYLYEQLYQLLPIIVILLILVMVSSISVSAISTRRRLKDYAKYYVLGLQWRQCVLVNFFQALTIGAAALLIACTGLFIVGVTVLSDTFMVIWNAPMLLTLLGILAMYLAFSMIMPLLMLRSTTPKTLLQTE